MRTVTPPGHSPDVWASRLAAADLLDPGEVVTSRPEGALLVVSAHPDDETIGAGRFVAWWAREVGEVRPLLLTAGEACLDHVTSRPPDLADRRLTEWSTALAALGVGALGAVAGLRDGQVSTHLDEVSAAVSAQLSGDVVTILAPWPGDPHPDHAAAGRAAARVARQRGLTVVHYPVWMTYWGDPEALAVTRDRVVRVRTTSADEEARSAALACFVTQLQPLADDLTPVVPKAMLEHHPTQLILIPAADRPIGVTCAAPPAFGLPEGYSRHDPSVEATVAAMRHLVAARPWRELTWPDLIEALVALGRTDVPLSRLVEGHIDAVRILDQTGSVPAPGGLYGVWASRSRGTGVRATPRDQGWQLHGTLRFASGVGVIDRALVPVWPDDDTHLLLDLAVGDWPADESAWQTDAMAVSRSHPTQVEAVMAGPDAVRGAANFYLTRPGFHAGGVGVAAVWAGGAARIVDLVLGHVGDSCGPPTRAVRLGRMRADLTSALATLRTAAERLEAAVPRADVAAIGASAGETRSVVATATLRILEEAKAVVGPAGLSYDAALTHAVADLDLYVRQFNADGEFGRLGADLR